MIRSALIHLTLFSTVMHAILGCHWHHVACAGEAIPCGCAAHSQNSDSEPRDGGCDNHGHGSHHDPNHGCHHNQTSEYDEERVVSDEPSEPTRNSEQENEQEREPCKGNSCVLVVETQQLSPAVALVKSADVTPAGFVVEPARLITNGAFVEAPPRSLAAWPDSVRAYLWKQSWLL